MMNKPALKRFAYFLSEEKGQSVVLFALALVALLGIMAFTVDVGYLQWQKRHLQNACDAAALAAAQELYDEGQEGDARQKAIEYLEANNITGIFEKNIEIDPDKRTVTISLPQTRDLAFARVLGINTGTVDAHAKAEYGLVTKVHPEEPGNENGGPSVVSGIVPFGIKNREGGYEPGDEITIKFTKNDEGENPSDDENPSDYGILHLDFFGFDKAALEGKLKRYDDNDKRKHAHEDFRMKNSIYEDNYKNYIINGYDGMLSVGDKGWTTMGDNRGPTWRGMKDRQCPHTPKCTYNDYKPTCPRVVVAPVVNLTGVKWYDGGKELVGGPHEVEIVAFKIILLKEPPENYKETDVIGWIIDEKAIPPYTEGETSGSNGNNGSDGGGNGTDTGGFLRKVHLVE